MFEHFDDQTTWENILRSGYDVTVKFENKVQFSGGYMRETIHEIKISIYDSAKFRNVYLVEMF